MFRIKKTINRKEKRAYSTILAMRFSIICVYNNKSVLDKCLIETLDEQTFRDYELILIDNTSGQYKNAGESLNFGASRAQGTYLLFLHQDVAFLSKTSLYELNRAVDEIEPFGIVGLAGVDKNETMYGNFRQGVNRLLSGKAFSKPIEVESIDECFFIIPQNLWLKNKLWEFSWHLYSVEYCLRMKTLNKRVLLLPCDIIYHLSPGNSLNNSYYSTMRVLGNRYRGKTRYVYTTIRGKWPTCIIGNYVKTYYYEVKNMLKNRLTMKHGAQ